MGLHLTLSNLQRFCTTYNTVKVCKNQISLTRTYIVNDIYLPLNSLYDGMWGP